MPSEPSHMPIPEDSRPDVPGGPGHPGPDADPQPLPAYSAPATEPPRTPAPETEPPSRRPPETEPPSYEPQGNRMFKQTECDASARGSSPL